MNREIRTFPDDGALTRAAAGEFARLGAEAVAAGGGFSVALSGGSTPRGLYSLLAEDDSFRDRVPWERAHLFWGDERLVPPDHPDSNYRAAREALLSRIMVPPENIHRIRGEAPDAASAAQEYDDLLRRFFRTPEGGFPRLDLVLLGLGTDAHTASLFPGGPELRETRKFAVPSRAPRPVIDRITLTPPVLNAAACVLFLVSGEEKAPALREVLEGAEDPDRLPAQRIRPRSGRLVWLVDRPAARLLERA
jgi:6-phosphogluconolactonase